ncbi:polysaccharide biosynthesis protein [Cellulomonas wangleii]|uniref:polysaccharide biosynthesis protein n=1 Tax=Cellulomonas wangleii TaxID=2816956 RepID=UPI0027DCF25F|nr:polysaccharide biosynthesis protein [Cellulomonas wangleii]
MRAVWADLVRTAGARAGVVALGGLLGVVSTRVVIEHFGVAAYAQYGLLNGLRNLLPFADLGIGAVVLNAVAHADDPARARSVHRVLTTAFRLLTVSGLVVAALCVVVQVGGWWPLLLGDGLTPGGDVVATLCLALFGLSLPLGVGSRILVGLRRTAAQTVLQGLVSPLFLAGVLALTLLGRAAGDWVALVSYAAASVVSAIVLAVAARIVAPQVGRALRDVPRVRAVPGVAVAATAVPMLVQSVAMPVAMQTDRLFLSHLASTDALAQYVFAGQMFGLVMQVVLSAGLSLWPHFARARAQDDVVAPFRLSVAFGVAAVLALGVLVLALPALEALVTDGALHLGAGVVLGWCGFVLVQAVLYPVGMYMTDEAGLRFQVVPVLSMCVSNVLLTWWLVGRLGAAGPVLASALAVLVCQLVPGVRYVRRDLARRASQGPSGVWSVPAADRR